MPSTNVSLEYSLAEKKYNAAQSLDEKYAALLEMRSHMPKHKGAENLRAEITRKIKTLSLQMEKKEAQRKKASAGHSVSVKKDGIAQIVIIGLPNSGKSTFLNTFTNSDAGVASYPFSTVKPEIGMMDFEKAKIQMVELPPIIEGSSRGKAMGPEMLAIARNADAILLIVDASTFDNDAATLVSELKAVGIELGGKKPPVKIEKSEFPGISITGRNYLQCAEKEAIEYLKQRGQFNVSLKIYGKAGINEIEQSMNSKTIYKNSLILVNTFGGRFYMLPFKFMDVPVVIWQKKSAEELSNFLFTMLDKVLVYTKKPREKIADKPMAVEKGANVFDVACTVHKDFMKTFKYAKVWGSTKFAGQRVSKNYEVRQNDMVEIYA